MAYLPGIVQQPSRVEISSALAPCCAAYVKRPAGATPFVLWMQMLLDAETNTTSTCSSNAPPLQKRDVQRKISVSTIFHIIRPFQVNRNNRKALVENRLIGNPGDRYGTVSPLQHSSRRFLLSDDYDTICSTTNIYSCSMSSLSPYRSASTTKRAHDRNSMSDLQSHAHFVCLLPYCPSDSKRCLHYCRCRDIPRRLFF